MHKKATYTHVFVQLEWRTKGIQIGQQLPVPSDKVITGRPRQTRYRKTTCRYETLDDNHEKQD